MLSVVEFLSHKLLFLGMYKAISFFICITFLQHQGGMNDLNLFFKGNSKNTRKSEIYLGLTWLIIFILSLKRRQSKHIWY